MVWSHQRASHRSLLVQLLECARMQSGQSGFCNCLGSIARRAMYAVQSPPTCVAERPRYVAPPSPQPAQSALGHLFPDRRPAPNATPVDGSASPPPPTHHRLSRRPSAFNRAVTRRRRTRARSSRRHIAQGPLSLRPSRRRSAGMWGDGELRKLDSRIWARGEP